MEKKKHVIEKWHELMQSDNTEGIDDLLDEHAVFHSPVVWTPQHGKFLTGMYLKGAQVVLGNESFEYVREIIGESDAMLEFKCEVDGVSVEGVDIISWNQAGKITDFKVLVRPLQAIQKVHEKMGEMLEMMKKKK
jgi:hypothetical protein